MIIKKNDLGKSKKKKGQKILKDMKITKDMIFTEVIQKYPETTKIFLELGMHCIGCPMAVQETVEQGARAHGIDIEELVKKLNNSIN